MTARGAETHLRQPFSQDSSIAGRDDRLRLLDSLLIGLDHELSLPQAKQLRLSPPGHLGAPCYRKPVGPSRGADRPPDLLLQDREALARAQCGPQVFVAEMGQDLDKQLIG